MNQWCHPTISSSVIPFSFCPQYFPASWSFPVSQLFTSGGQRIGASASASVLPLKIQGWFPLGLTGLISLLSKGLSRVFSNTTIRKQQFFGAHPSLRSDLTSVHEYWKNHSFDYTDLCQLCPTLCNSVDCSPPGSSVHGILQARVLEWVAIPFSKGSSRPRDQAQVSCIAGRFFIWANREAFWGANMHRKQSLSLRCF